MAFELMYMGQKLAVLIYSMTIEKGKAQKNKNKAAKNEILSNIKNPRARFNNAGENCKNIFINYRTSYKLWELRFSLFFSSVLNM